ncbi:AhpC/TSA family protein [Mycobacterium simiae]|uniref:AhpC/TSA family protein n=1 Tax=Mycobacterium simiae TaxID=1784 RepID=A0A5B1BUL6_MYCSI|nr:peroxiredoxin family protein [Mycobacterium simiae]KAA1250829.1 AhpC/TSA family protein [Mycobacterium simiae]
MSTTKPLWQRRIKRWSIVTLLAVDAAAVTAAVVGIVTAAPNLPARLAWVAAGVAGLALPVQLAAFLRLRRGRTGRNLPVMSAAAVIAVVVAVLGGVVGKTPWPALAAVLAWATTQAYARWYTRLDRVGQDALEVGNPMPEFEVVDLDGSVVRSLDFLGRPVVMVFIRGNWCPLCVAQVRELAGQYRALADRGVQVMLISPQPLDETRALADRFGVPFRYLQDPGAQAAQQLGLRHEGGVPPGLSVLGYQPDTVFPTVIVADAHGRIVFSDQTDDYRLRPEPATFLAALDTPASWRRT